MACVHDDAFYRSLVREFKDNPIAVVGRAVAFGFPAVAHVRAATRHNQIPHALKNMSLQAMAFPPLAAAKSMTCSVETKSQFLNTSP
jgi:hypothetical protein